MSVSVALPLDGPSVPPANGGPAGRLVVFLHGYGADGTDLISLAPIFAEHFPDAAFHAPHAPFPCEVMAGGRQWFSLAAVHDPALMTGDPAKLGAAFAALERDSRSVLPTLDATLDGLLDHYGLPADRLALVGFSQGTMMALLCAPRRAQPVAAVVGFSGSLLSPASLPTETRARPPVLLVHGDADDVVPVSRARQALPVLKAAGFNASLIEVPGLPHAIDDTGLDAAIALLERVWVA
ncbi:phospholipase [Rhodospirillum rubrum]|uniref:alpha/beta hydrolase n=1 Tax=Rhodospirillum rubrum TaxID=1085 RepID=UPI0019045ABC|nr:alpha/beta fold hydrolase [Rhodospirillum rubrum]MBK1664943.1 phospholipase [Rhodospirillum rubrum]MBK1677209.1 phospholipase [Rhodospirillum rubrum]